MRLLLLFIACCLAWPAAAQQTPPPARTVKHQVLTSGSLPRIRLKFDKDFKYAGTQSFVLYERSQAQQFFFVDAGKGGQIKRMYMIQFEGYLPTTNATYDYAVTASVDLHGQTYITNTESVPSISALLKQAPDSDAARAVAFLTQKGLHMSDSVRYQRFVRLVDDAKRNEFIIVYIEDAGTKQDDKEFSARALKGITVLD